MGVGIAALGDSITRGASDEDNASLHNGNSWFNVACVLSRHRRPRVRNAGVGGDGSIEMLARVASDVIAYNPAVCPVLAGTNDIGAQGRTAAATMATITQIYEALRAAHIVPIACTVPPRNASNGGTAGVKAGIDELNLRIRRYAAQQGMVLLDFHRVLTDPSTNEYRTGYSSDGVHPSGRGSRAMAERLGGSYVSRPHLSDANSVSPNILSNGLFLVDSDANGVPDNWTNSSLANATFSIQTRTSDLIGKWAQISKSVAQAGTASTLTNNITTGFAVGDRLYLGARIQTANIEAPPGGGSSDVSFRLKFNGPGTLIQPMKNWSVDLADGLVLIEATVPAATTSIDVILNLSGEGAARMGQVTLANLTALGLT